MTKVSDSAAPSDEARRNDLPDVPEEASFPEVEAYDTEDGVVLYDADNPLAWLKATHARPLSELR